VKRVLVVGGSRGIGLAITTHFKQRGDAVFITARYGIEDICDRLGVYGAHGHVAQDAHDIVRKAHLALGGLDIVINTAGTISGRDNAVIETNVLGTWRLCQEALVYRPESIVLFSGGGVGGPHPGADVDALYTATKAAVVQMAECLAARYPGTRVNSVAPGQVATRLTGWQGASADAAVALVDWLTSAAGRHVTGRLVSVREGTEYWAEPEPEAGKLRRIMP